MKKTFLTKLLCGVLAVMMAASCAAFSAGAEEHDHDHGYAVAEATAKVIKPSAISGMSNKGRVGEFLEELGIDEEPTDTTDDGEDGTPKAEEGCDHDWVEKSSYEGYNCDLGSCWMYYWECSICGAQRQIAFRDWDGKGLGQHEWVQKTVKSECSENPTVEQTCKLCKRHEIVEAGGHNWQPDGDVIPGARCTDYSKQKYVCADCGATKTESTGVKGTHEYVEMSSEPTCTEPGYTWKECTKCHHVILKTAIGNPLGHKWTTDGDHTVGRTCSVCGMTSGATEHTWSGWQSDESAHWKECTQCKTMDINSYNEHTFNAQGKCTVCGHSKPVCDHDWVGPKMFGPFNHQYECSICKEKMTVSCAAVTSTARDDCTKDVYCICGNKVLDGQKRHNFGTWRCTDSSHIHECLNTGCKYGHVEEPHSYVNKAGVVMCSVCSYVDKAASVEHKHTYGPWTVGENSCVTFCTDPTCGDIVTTAHIAGTADCLGNATCKICGGAMKVSPNTANHVGATEIRGAVAAEVGKAGYTGDTVCLTCGKVIAKGQTIEALKPSHVHAYTTLQHDSTGHWNVCECGEKEAVVGHSGGAATCASQAVCSVCGEKYGALATGNHVGGTQIINIVAAEVGKAGYTGDTQCLGCGAVIAKGEAIPALTAAHQHAYNVKYDSVEHWTECECGSVENTAAHTYENGVCSVCGAKEPDKIEDAHVHSYAATFTTSAEYHWHVCSTCGGQNGLEKHMFMDDKCVTCGMTLERSEVKEAREQAIADLQGEKSVLKVFTDMADATVDTYYALPVQRLYNAGIMKGTSNSSFDGQGSITRQQVMIVMARMQGQHDLDAENWSATLAHYMEWAAEAEITVPGAVDGAASREETVYMLWVMAGRPESTQDLGAYADAGKVEAEYAAAVRWAVEKGILLGNDKGEIMPDDNVSRRDAATLIVRYVDKMGVIL